MYDPNQAAEKLKAQSRREVIGPLSGVPYLIRKIHPRDFLSTVEIAKTLDLPTMPILPADATDEQRGFQARVIAERAAKIAASKDYMKAWYAVILRGVVGPKILLDDEQVAGSGEVNAWDIPSAELEWLCEQVIEFSGLGREAQASASFREGAPANAGDGGSTGDAVRGAPA